MSDAIGPATGCVTACGQWSTQVDFTGGLGVQSVAGGVGSVCFDRCHRIVTSPPWWQSSPTSEKAPVGTEREGTGFAPRRARLPGAGASRGTHCVRATPRSRLHRSLRGARYPRTSHRSRCAVRLEALVTLAPRFARTVPVRQRVRRSVPSLASRSSLRSDLASLGTRRASLRWPLGPPPTARATGCVSSDCVSLAPSRARRRERDAQYGDIDDWTDDETLLLGNEQEVEQTRSARLRTWDNQ